MRRFTVSGGARVWGGADGNRGVQRGGPALSAPQVFQPRATACAKRRPRLGDTPQKLRMALEPPLHLPPGVVRVPPQQFTAIGLLDADADLPAQLRQLIV